LRKMKNKSQQINWLMKEINKDSIELENEKQKYVNEIKQLKREDMFPKPKKLTLWQRIKKVLMI
jgi:hypothetical protein